MNWQQEIWSLQTAQKISVCIQPQQVHFKQVENWSSNIIQHLSITCTLDPRLQDDALLCLNVILFLQAFLQFSIFCLFKKKSRLEPHCKCWELETQNFSSIDWSGFTFKPKINCPMDNLPISADGLLFIRTFLYHNGLYLSANGRQFFCSEPLKESVILDFGPFSSNERLYNL